jgi:carbon-monoxide dehydrogenase medium subunit
MKPAPFEYFAPDSIDEALELLTRHGDDAKILAGGQSLMPLMNLRLARPKVIVDINRLPELDFISARSDGVLTIGCLVRQRAIERSVVVKEQNPLLAATVPMIGHFQIRNRGTIGGSIAHADPAAELPAVTLLLDAQLWLRSASGIRTVPAAEFYLGYMTTAMEPAELLTEIHFPRWRRGDGWAIEEISRRKGDFAMVGVAARVQMDEAEIVEDVAIAMFGIGGKPERMAKAEKLLKGHRVDQRLLLELAKTVADDLNPDTDLHASAQYRKEVGGVLARRALESALIRAKGTTN